MNLVFINRSPNPTELEKFRLLLSTYQDGSGQLTLKDNLTLPGWRDFERCTALAFNGHAQENKSIFDVLLTDYNRPNVNYGISCKMRGTLQETTKQKRTTLELSNSAGEFWNNINAKNLIYENHPNEIGKTLIETVKSWYEKVDLLHGGNIDISQSFYLTLQWNKKTLQYQLFQFPLLSEIQNNLNWSTKKRRIIGKNVLGATLFEWYGYSGGQLKYYPPINTAIWASHVFELEPLPQNNGTIYAPFRKVIEYFPNIWAKIQHDTL